MLPSAKANLCKLVQCCLYFLTIEVSVVCHATYSKRTFRRKITDLSNPTINFQIPLLGAGPLFVDDAHGLGNLPDALPHFMIYLLCCQATLILPNPHGFCCPLADSITGVLSPDGDLYSRNVDCISICNDQFRQREGITVHDRFSQVVNDWVVDIECFLLWTSIGSVEYIVKGDAMQ